MKTPHLPNINHPVESITPLYDLLLVRRLDDREHVGLIIAPNMKQTKDGRWVRTADEGPRRGEVVAMGRGDKIPGQYEAAMRSTFEEFRENGLYAESEGTFEHSRQPMAVKLGDVIIYPRFESTHVMIQGEQLTFVHEADVMAVIEPDEAEVGISIRYDRTGPPEGTRYDVKADMTLGESICAMIYEMEEVGEFDE